MSVSFARCGYAYIYFNLQHDGRLSSDYLGFLHSVSYFFFLYRSPLSSLGMIFNSVSSNIDEVLSINPSGVFVVGDFDRPNELCCKFAISNDLSIRWLTILLGSLIVALTFLLFLIYFLLTPLANCDHIVVSVSIDFLSNSKRDALFISFLLHWQIVIMLLSQFLLKLRQQHDQNGMPFFIEYFTTIFVLLGRSS